MKKIIRKLSENRWFFDLALKIVANRIVHCQNLLTPEYLEARGWIKDGLYWVEPDIKDRDKIWIQFDAHYFRVWKGKEQTFIGLESKVEWFELFYLLSHGDNGRYELANV